MQRPYYHHRNQLHCQPAHFSYNRPLIIRNSSITMHSNITRINWHRHMTFCNRCKSQIQPVCLIRTFQAPLFGPRNDNAIQQHCWIDKSYIPSMEISLGQPLRHIQRINSINIMVHINQDTTQLPIQQSRATRNDHQNWSQKDHWNWKKHTWNNHRRLWCFPTNDAVLLIVHFDGN